MKIKEIARLSGLTEKSIRYYESKGLVVPVMEERNGRMFRTYTEEDLKKLESIATLRKARFSVEDIQTMLSEPEKIPETLRDYRLVVEEAYESLLRIREMLQSGTLDKAGDIHALAEALRSPVENVPLPKEDVKFNFRRYDQLVEQERSRISAATLKGRLGGWAQIYSGRSVQTYQDYQQRLSAAGVRFRALTYNKGSRMALQGFSNTMNNVGFNRAPTPTPHGLQEKLLSDKGMDYYRIEVRSRDVEKARMALRANL